MTPEKHTICYTWYHLACSLCVNIIVAFSGEGKTYSVQAVLSGLLAMLDDAFTGWCKVEIYAYGIVSPNMHVVRNSDEVFHLLHFNM